MASEETRTRTTPALVILDERAMGATLTATTQAGPHAGIAEPDQTTAAVLEATGDYSTPLDDVEVAAVNAGGVGTGTFRWRYSGQDMMSHDPPLMVTDADFIHRSTTSGAWRYPHAIRLASGLAVATITADTDTAKVMVEDAAGDWTTTTLEDTGFAARTSLCVDVDGVIYAYLVADLDYSGGASQIRMYRSSDDGATWTIGSRAALAVPIEYASSAIKRIRVAWLAGQVLLLVWVHDGTDYLMQYVSSDGGATFALVETTSTTDEGAPDVVAWGGSLYVATVRYVAAGTTLLPYLRVLSVAGVPLSSVDPVLATTSGDTAEWATRAGSLLTAAECALLVDDDGRVWVYGLDYAGDSETLARVSVDGGVTWSAAMDPCVTGDAATHLKDLTVAPGRGRALMLATYTGAPSTADDSVIALRLGGWSTWAMPEWAGVGEPAGVTGWERVYLPLDYPTDNGYTEIGAGSAVVGADGLAVTCTAGQSLRWSIAPTVVALTEDAGCIATMGVDLDLDAVARIAVVWSDGANDYSATVSLTRGFGLSHVLAIEDDNGAGADSVVVLGAQVEIRIALLPGPGFTADDGVAVAMVRDTSNEGARGWQELTLTGLVRGAATVAALRWSVAESTADIRWWGYTGSAFIGDQDPTADPARGRRWCGTSSPAHLVGGLRVGMADGPALSGDTWQIATAYDYPVAAIDPSVAPSPAVRWRSTNDSQTDIVLTSAIGWRAGDLVAFVVLGANFRTAAIYADAGASTKIADVDMTGGQDGLAFVRSKNQLRPASSGGASAADRLMVENSLAGARAVTGAGPTIRKIATNWSGAWLASDPSNYHAARIILEDYDNADPSSGDTLEVWYPGAVIVTTVMESTDVLMLRIPTQATLENYFELGLFAVGRVVVLAHEYDESRMLGRTPGAEVVTLPGGGRSARVLSPSRRMVDVSWDEGVPSTGLHTPGSAPNYLRSGTYIGAAPVAARAETAGLLDGLYAQVQGGYRPVVYLPSLSRLAVAPTATTPAYIVGPDRYLYGRITSEEMRIDTVRGDEHSATRPERHRIATIRIEEEL